MRERATSRATLGIFVLIKQWGERISGEKGGLGEGNKFGRLLKYILEVLETDSFLISLPSNSVFGIIPYEN